MKAYKFLRVGRVGAFSGEPWPEDTTIEVEVPLAECRNGVHACRAEDLAYWLDDELWEIELEGELVEGPLKLVARRGRLVRPLDAWNDDARREFAWWCLRRAASHAADELRDAGLDDPGLSAAASAEELSAAAERAVESAQAAGAATAERLAQYVVDAVVWTNELPPSAVAYVAAHVADSRSRSEVLDAFAAERVLQASWLADRLGLSAELA